ncbi:phosphatase PAP2 family protein [Candidatus Saccharibacteria bacterium]|nr:phosphatase PAP2 family protein [Candidatus Saccharibacteria bacterium]
MQRKKNLFYAIFFSILAVIFTILTKNIDVKPIGPESSAVGFATWNLAVHQGFGFNETLYKITEILGYLLFGFVLVYAILGLAQLVKRKSFFKVDRGIICFGALILAMLAVYVLFDKLALNFRPVILDGELEPSYPSSHTLFALCIAGGVILLNKGTFANSKFAKIISIAAMFLASFTVVGRMLSGVHWITDILGGILISAALVSIYNLFLTPVKSDKIKNKH